MKNLSIVMKIVIAVSLMAASTAVLTNCGGSASSSATLPTQVSTDL